jgi:branched-chain amino acid transport system ATP-binding protein
MLDEPSLGLAPLIVEGIMQSLEELRAEGVTILLVEQYAQRAIRLADRAYVLNGGEIVLETVRGEVSAGALEDAYLGARRRGREVHR